MSFLKKSLNSIRIRLTFLILVLAAFLSMFVGTTLYHSYFESGQSARNKIRNELSNHLNVAAGIQAIERGVGNTILGGNHELIPKFHDLGIKGDMHVGMANTIAKELIDQGILSADFTDKYNAWKNSLQKLQDARLLVEEEKLSSTEWFNITTNNILMEFNLQDAVFIPLVDAESDLYFNSSLRPNIALLAEYAGRERAIIGNIIETDSEISRETEFTLDRYRSHVDRAVQQLQNIRDNTSTSPELKRAIIHFESIFLGSYEELRQKIFRISTANHNMDEQVEMQLKDAVKSVLDYLHGVNIQLSSLAENVHLTGQINNQIDSSPSDLLRVEHVFQDLADIQRRYRQIRYLDDNGREQLRVDYVGEQSKIIPKSKLQDKSKRPYFMESINLPQGEIYISPLDLNIEGGEISVPFIPMIRFASPVYINGRSHGVVVLNVSAGQFLHKLPEGVFLVNKDGYYLHHPDPEKEWGMMDALNRRDRNVPSEYPELADILLFDYPKEVEVGNKSVFFRPIHFHPNNPDMFWILMSVRDREPYPLTGSQWIEQATEAINTALEISNLIGKIANNTSERKIKNADLNMAILLALAIAMMTFIVIFFRELNKVGIGTATINAEVDRLASGDLSRRINFVKNIDENDLDVRSLNEIDSMALNINKMAENLEIQTEKLKIQSKELLAAKEEAESANSTKSEFLATMSHEIRTPMTSVMGFADLLLASSLSDEEKSKVYNIKDSARSLLRIINDILDVSKMDAGKMGIEHIDFHLPSAIDDVLLLFQEKRTGGRIQNLILEDTFSDDFPDSINSDPVRIRQILVNLIGNAMKFTEKGSVNVEGTRYRSEEGKDCFRISVRDTGIGIRSEVLDDLFTDFTQADASITRRFEGTGLGLSICKKLVELMGGEIGAESEFGKGSTFWFTLPYVPSTKEVIASSKASSSTETRYKAIRPLHILAVDDNGLNQQVIAATVSGLGHTVQVAKEGMQALLMHSEGDYDLILMDIRMPVMSGPDATKLIRKMEGDKATIPIIALTADVTEEHKAGYYDAGMNAVATKPIDIAELALAMNNVMGEEIHVAEEVVVEVPETKKNENTNAEPNPEIAELIKRFQDIAEEND